MIQNSAIKNPEKTSSKYMEMVRLLLKKFQEILTNFVLLQIVSLIQSIPEKFNVIHYIFLEDAGYFWKRLLMWCYFFFFQTQILSTLSFILKTDIFCKLMWNSRFLDKIIHLYDQDVYKVKQYNFGRWNMWNNKWRDVMYVTILTVKRKKKLTQNLLIFPNILKPKLWKFLSAS